MKTRKLFWAASICCVVCLARAQAVETANVTVGPLGGGPAVSIANGSANFFLDNGAVDGEFPIRIGNSAADDFANGILLSSVTENGRDVSGEMIYAAANVLSNNSSQAVGGGTAGGWAVSTRRAGINPPGSLVGGGDLMNTNFGAAYFPFSEGWVGGHFSSSSVSGTGDAVAYGAVDQFNLNGLLSTNIEIEAVEPGYHRVTIPGVTDTRRQGILFATAGDNVGRYALAGPYSDGTAYSLATIDNDHFFVGDPDEANEDDGRLTPSSFVFIPRDTPGVTMASVHGATVNNLQTGVLEPTALQSSGNFTLTREAAGQFRLSIPGQTPSSGTLLLNGGNQGSGGQGGRVGDNVYTYQPDGNDWIILSQDPESNAAYTGDPITPLTGEGQSNVNPEVYFNFAFVPHDGSVTGPGAIQPASNYTNMTTSRIIGWNAEVVDYNGGNADGDMGHVVVGGTSDVNIQALYDNRGDMGVAVDGAFLSTSEGVLFATVREGFRDNSGVGGLLEYGVIGVSDDFSGPDWKIHTAIADPANGEHNINYSAVYFGVDSGFEMAQEVPTTSGAVNVTVPGLGSTDEGALFVTPHGNDDNFVIATPNGTSWDVLLRDNGIGAGEGDQVNHIYLPYDAENLVAGQVAADGTLLGSTDPAGFTLTRELIDLPDDFDPTARPAYRLSIPGVSPDDGMLMLTGTGDDTGGDGDGANSVVYLPDPSGGNDFIILGLDHRTSSDPAPFVIPEDTGFYFAFIDFDNPPSISSLLGCDFDNSGTCDISDIDMLVAEAAAGTNGMDFDLTGDGTVDFADVEEWLAQAGEENLGPGRAYLVADANLDGVVDGQDFIAWNGNKFTSLAAWSGGDFNADGIVDGQDFIAWNGNKFQSADFASVPEPSSLVLLMIGFVSLVRRGRRDH